MQPCGCHLCGAILVAFGEAVKDFKCPDCHVVVEDKMPCMQSARMADETAKSDGKLTGTESTVYRDDSDMPVRFIAFVW